MKINTGKVFDMNKQYKTILDKPMVVNHVAVLDKMITELSTHMRDDEVDKCIGFLHTLKDTKIDVNWTATDAKTQICIMLGSDRFQELAEKWSAKNQKFLTVFGTLKFKRKSDKTLWDGLDEEDKVEDYDKVYI